MVEQIQVKTTVKKAPLFEQIAVGINFLAPVGYFYYLWRTGQEFYFANPIINLFAHAMLIVIPIVWSFIFTAGKIKVDPPGEFLAYGDSKREWWTSIILYPSLILGVLFAGHFAWQLFNHPASQSLTTVGDAVFVFILATLFAIGIKLKEKHRINIWSSDEGLHLGMSRFIRWTDIHHVRWLGRDVEVYHQNNQDVPAVIFSVRDDAPFKLLNEHLSKHNIVPSNVLSTKFILIQVTIAILAIGVLVGGLMAHFSYGFKAKEIFAYALGFGIFVMYQLEKIYIAGSTKRGLPKVSRDVSPADNQLDCVVTPAQIQEYGEICITTIRERFGKNLSYDNLEETARILDEILKSDDFVQKFPELPDDKGVYVMIGAFLGELLRRNSDAHWVFDVKRSPWLNVYFNENYMQVFPFEKVEKHRETGAPGDLLFYIQIVTGRVKVDLSKLTQPPPELPS